MFVYYDSKDVVHKTGFKGFGDHTHGGLTFFLSLVFGVITSIFIGGVANDLLADYPEIQEAVVRNLELIPPSNLRFADLCESLLQEKIHSYIIHFTFSEKLNFRCVFLWLYQELFLSLETNYLR